MAVLKRGILGGFSGSVANVVGTSWKGIDVMRSKPLSVANPRTAAQTTQRGKFSQVVLVASELLVNVVKPLWDRFAQRKSGYNAFVKANIDFFDETTLSDPSDFVIGQGNLQSIDNITVLGEAAATEFQLLWTDNSGVGNASGTDQLYVAVYDQTNDFWYGYSTVATRADEGGIVGNLPAFVSGDMFYVYAAFRKADGTAVSNSISKPKVVS